MQRPKTFQILTWKPHGSILIPLAFLWMLTNAWSTELIWTGGNGIWDDSDTSVWTPNQTPVDGDLVKLDVSGGANIQFASNITPSANLLGTSSSKGGMTLGGSGDPTTLQFGLGDTLSINAPNSSTPSLLIQNGGNFHMTGGDLSLQSQSLGSWSTAIDLRNGGNMLMTGGNLGLYYRENVRVANSSGHSAKLVLAGDAKITYNTINGGDLEAKAGNSDIQIHDQAIFQVSRNINIGSTSGDHRLTISGGNLDVLKAGTSKFGGGTGSTTLQMSGGNFVGHGSSKLTIDSGAEFNKSGGYFKYDNLLFGAGNMNITGGDVQVTYEFSIAHIDGKSANVILDNGSSSLTARGIAIGGEGKSGGSFPGDASNLGGAGTLIHRSGNIFVSNGTLDFRVGHPLSTVDSSYQIEGGVLDRTSSSPDLHVYPSGNIVGFGNILLPGKLYQAGQVIANGLGQEKSLVMTSFNSILNTTDNASNEGWFAINKGELLLPEPTIATNNSVVWWGEDSANDGDGTIDMVNSLQFNFSNVSGAGKLSIALIASDRSEVPSNSALGSKLTKLATYRITDNSNFNLGSGSYNLTVRYDSTAVTNPAKLVIYHHNGSAWTKLNTSVDTTNKTITANSIQSFGYFSVMEYDSPTGCLFTLR